MNVIVTEEVIRLWTLPNRKPPSTTTIWRYTRQGLIPKPRKIGNTNLYDREEVIKRRNRAWGLDK